MSESKPIRVLIVDDHAMVRSGLRDFISAFEWMEAIGEARNGVEAVEFCASQDVDVVLMDMVMPVMNGSEAARRIMALGKPIKIVALTSFHEQDLVKQALQDGATSYLLKNVSADELAAAILASYGGRSMLAPEATAALVAATRPESSTDFGLTEREREVLGLVAQGLSNQDISDSLCISMPTVKFHLSNIFTKLDVRNRVEAATLALDHKLIDR